MNQFKCPNKKCEQNTTPVYLEYPETNVECGSCGTHGATVEVAADE